MREYAKRHRLKFNIKEQLGEGTDGAVWATSKDSVIKVIKREKTFETEFRCYERLMSRRVKEIDGLAVPAIIECSRDLQIIEMTLVHPPYLLDFGKAYIDEPAPYTPEQLEEWHQQWRHFFPKADIPRVHKVLRLLKGYGIDYVDPRGTFDSISTRQPLMTMRTTSGIARDGRQVLNEGGSWRHIHNYPHAVGSELD